LINKLREAKALQIAIEARFIQVDTSFLQSIGVNLDMYFNTGSRLGSSATVDPWTSSIVGAPQTVPQSRNGNTGAQTASGWGAGAAHWNELTPVPVVGNNTGINFTTPTSLKTGTGLDIGSLVTTPAMTTGFTFLDEIQVNFLLQATQASATTRNLTAPRITLFNGQRAYVSVATEQAYVSGLTAVPSEGTGTVGVGGTVVNSPTYTPTISYVPTGATLDVEATISADRRYVTMTLRPQVCTLVSFATYAVNGVANSVSSQGNISLPTVVIQDIQTTVSVPDGGTLLLGGQKLATETDREIGVPVLSKIPVIDRLFTSRGTERDEETLLILVKPKIIIQKEEEEKSFP
jgi:type II secretory pathway component GspD/PulD (secretin)